MKQHTANTVDHRSAPATRLVSFGLLGTSLLLAGCRQDMHNQPKFYPQRGTTLFADGRSVRPQVENTVARNQGDETSYFNTGLIGGKEGDGLPLPLTPELMARGQERFNIYCTPCHSRVGNGLGMIVQRGYALAGNFHTERLRTIGLGHFFSVITNGYGAMPDYAAQLTPQDRWAVAAYIRALQLSQNATQADVPSGNTVRPLSEIATQQGLPAAAAEPWPVPPTATPLSNSVNGGEAGTVPTPPSTGKQAAPEPPAGSETPASGAPSAKPISLALPTHADISAGAALYQQNCQLCHQPTLQGMPTVIPSLLGIVAKVGPARIHEVVTNGIPTGKPPMPAMGDHLTPADIDKIIAYIQFKSVPKAEAVEPQSVPQSEAGVEA